MWTNKIKSLDYINKAPAHKPLTVLICKLFLDLLQDKIELPFIGKLGM